LAAAPRNPLRHPTMAANRALSYTGIGAPYETACKRTRQGEGRNAMAAKTKKVNRILVIKIKLPTAEAITSLSMMMKSATPFYPAFGDAKVRLLRNVDSPADVIQIVEYEAEHGMELNRQKFASDPMARNILQGWRMLFPGGVEMDVYEDVTESA
jgi:hypothetical protein